MPQSKNRRKSGKPAEGTNIPTSALPPPLATAAGRLKSIGIGVRFRQGANGGTIAKLEGYQPLTDEDGEDLVRNAALMTDEDWADFLRPKNAVILPAPELLRAAGRYVILPIDHVRADAAPCEVWPLSADRPEDLLGAIPEAIARPMVEIRRTMPCPEGQGLHVDLDNLTIPFQPDDAPEDPLLAALFRAASTIHPFSDPEDVRLARALVRDVGHGRRLLVNGDLLTADEPPRLIDRHEVWPLIEELERDYDLSDPRSAVHILGDERARDIAEEVLIEADEEMGDLTAGMLMGEDPDEQIFEHDEVMTGAGGMTVH